MNEPQLRLFMQDHAEPKSVYDHRDGRWIGEPSWPSPNVERRTLRLGRDGTLGGRREDDREAALTLNSPLSVGRAGGKWCSYAGAGDQPVDQRADDAGSLTFETEPLAEALEIAGDATLDLAFSCDRAVAIVAVRLSDVAPDGAATRVSYGLFNLTHRESHEFPEALEPGRQYTVKVPFKHVAQHFRVGHRLRLSISTNYFPLAWPAPEAATLTVYPAACGLELPVRRPGESDAALPAFGEARSAPPLETEVIAAAKKSWKVIDDLGSGETRFEILDDLGSVRIVDNGLTVATRGEEEYGFRNSDYRSVYGRACWTVDFSRGNWSVRTITDTTMTATADTFEIKATLEAFEGDERVRRHEWRESIPRKLV